MSAVGSVHYLTAFDSARFGARVRWHRFTEARWRNPTGPHAANKPLDLVISKHAAGALRESGHRSSGYAKRNDATQRLGCDHSLIHRIIERLRRAVTSFGTMASLAVLVVKPAEIHLPIGPRLRAGRFSATRR